MQTKSKFFSKFFAYYLSKVHLHQPLKMKVIKSHETVDIKVFLAFFA